MNRFLDGLKNDTNLTLTENGAVTHKFTMSAVYDLFALGSAYRQRSDNDVLTLFSAAFEEDRDLALKCLFYIRDIRGGQGERRFFRLCFHWLAVRYPEIARKNLEYLSEYGRYDDMWYSTFGTPLEKDTLKFIKDLLTLDISCKAPSLLAKWLPSENASSSTTKHYARMIKNYLGMTSKQYRKTLSYLREKINIVERLMSLGEWDKIEFDKIPSKAGIKYKNAFARRDMIAKKYETFAKSENTKVNAKTLYPYEVVEKAERCWSYLMDNVDRLMINKYWANLADYFNGKTFNGMVMADTSGSMTWGSSPRPIDIAVSLALYCADKAHGPFHGNFITFESVPHFMETKGYDFVDKVRNIYRAPWGRSTDVEAAFDLMLNTAIRHKCSSDEIPENLIIVSDMEFNSCVTSSRWGTSNATLMERIAAKWSAAGYTMPKLIFWNVNARNDNIPMKAKDGITFVSGASPVIFEMIMSGKTSIDLMLDKLLSDRYAVIKA